MSEVNRNERIYSPGQAVEIFPYWPLRPRKAEWFVIGGPADADEAQTVHKKFPEVKCIGFEPNPKYGEHQTENNFPGKVYQCALWDEDKEVPFFIKPQDPRSSSVCRDFEGEPTEVGKVAGRSLDSLSEELGPFTNVVLWLDIEFAERQALEGAKNLFDKGQILLANIEVWDSNFDGIDAFLKGHEMELVHEWSYTVRDKRDVVYRARFLSDTIPLKKTVITKHKK